MLKNWWVFNMLEFPTLINRCKYWCVASEMLKNLCILLFFFHGQTAKFYAPQPGGHGESLRNHRDAIGTIGKRARYLRWWGKGGEDEERGKRSEVEERGNLLWGKRERGTGVGGKRSKDEFSGRVFLDIFSAVYFLEVFWGIVSGGMISDVFWRWGKEDEEKEEEGEEEDGHRGENKRPLTEVRE